MGWGVGGVEGERVEEGEQVSLEQLSVMLPQGGALLSNTSVRIKQIVGS